MDYNENWPQKTLAQFVRSPEWEALPFRMKLALLHLQRAEQLFPVKSVRERSANATHR